MELQNRPKYIPVETRPQKQTIRVFPGESITLFNCKLFIKAPHSERFANHQIPGISVIRPPENGFNPFDSK